MRWHWIYSLYELLLVSRNWCEKFENFLKVFVISWLLLVSIVITVFPVIFCSISKIFCNGVDIKKLKYVLSLTIFLKEYFSCLLSHDDNSSVSFLKQIFLGNSLIQSPIRDQMVPKSGGPSESSSCGPVGLRVRKQFDSESGTSWTHSQRPDGHEIGKEQQVLESGTSGS